MALFALFGQYQTYDGHPFVELSAANPPFTLTSKAPATGIVTYSKLNSPANQGLLLHPDPEVVFYWNQAQVNGVLTHLTFTPQGVLTGPTITAEAKIGIFAYFQDYYNAGYKLSIDASASSVNSGLISDIVVTGNKLITSAAPPETVGTQLVNLANSVRASGDVTLYQETLALADVAFKWGTTKYFLDIGTGLHEVSQLDIGFGVEVKLGPGGSPVTWVTNTQGSYSVAVSGYTAVGGYSGSTTGGYKIVNALTNGEIDLAFVASTAAQFSFKAINNADLVNSVGLTNFAQTQFAFGKQIHVQDPMIFAHEALGLALVEASTPFKNQFGPTVLSDAAFVSAAYSDVFGVGPTAPQTQHFLQQLAFFDSIYTASGAYGSAARIDLLSRGAVYGQMLGFAAESDNTHAISTIVTSTSDLFGFF